MRSPQLSSYVPFIRTGTVSVLASDVRVPVTILRDTGAFDSFIKTGLLSLTAESETEDSVPLRGMALKVLGALLHKIMLDCELFQVQVKLAVRPAFPIEGISVILCNDLAGDRVWSDDHSEAIVACVYREVRLGVV